MHTLTIAAAVENWPRARDFITDCTSLLPLSGDRAHEIYLAVEEAFVNICTHAYPRPNGHERVEIRCNADEHNKRISITLIDSGLPFDPVSAPGPDITSDIYGRPVGGLGIHLIKEVTDELSYTRENEANRLTMTFKAR